MLIRIINESQQRLLKIRIRKTILHKPNRLPPHSRMRIRKSRGGKLIVKRPQSVERPQSMNTCRRRPTLTQQGSSGSTAAVSPRSISTRCDSIRHH